jgi:hypothetical protein
VNLKRINDRSKTYYDKNASQISIKEDSKSTVEGGKKRAHTYKVNKADSHLWKSKVDTLLAEKKNWLVEKKELREKLRSIELQNDELLLRIKKVRKMMVDDDEAL